MIKWELEKNDYWIDGQISFRLKTFFDVSRWLNFYEDIDEREELLYRLDFDNR